MKENCRIMERILAFTGKKTLGKPRIIRLQNTGKCMQNTAFSVSSLFIFRTVNAMFFAVYTTVINRKIEKEYLWKYCMGVGSGDLCQVRHKNDTLYVVAMATIFVAGSI